jgi:DNA-binding XRE family transcriptional regulator
MGPIAAEVVEEKQRRDVRGRKIVDAPRRAELLAVYEASGLTQRRFARQEGINVLHVLPFYQLEIRATRPHVSRHWWALKGGAKMHPQTIGEHIKKRRLELGLEQEQVAAEVGVTWLSVNNWERGIYRPTKKAMIPIIAFLGYDPRSEKT